MVAQNVPSYMVVYCYAIIGVSPTPNTQFFYLVLGLETHVLYNLECFVTHCVTFFRYVQIKFYLFKIYLGSVFMKSNLDPECIHT